MLNESRVWDDQGTGHVSSIYVEKFKGMSLLVRSEADGTILLESKIQTHTAYQKQQDTLIVWSEADNYDFALSFQDKAGCDEIWEKICQVQGKDPSVEITQDIMEQEPEDMDDDRFEEIPDAAPPIELPPCELSKLEEISELFNSVLLSPVRREKLCIALNKAENENKCYIKKLLDLFHMCEDLDNIEGLHHLYDIFKTIFLLNQTLLFNIMFAEDTIYDVIGVLEYDPSLPQIVKHREFLKNQAKFKEVIPLNNPELVAKIHQTYRVQYIQDVILPAPSMFEENSLSTLSAFLFFNKVEIVSMIQEDEKFLQSLFAQLTSDDTEELKRRDLVLFLKEFCTFSQTVQPQDRESFFKTLSNMGILETIEIVLGLEDEKMKSAAVDIFSYIVEFSPSMVREFILQETQKQDDEDLLINLVIEQMLNDTDPELGGAMQLMTIIRLLIDPDNMLGTANKTERTDFLGFFYKHSMHVLTAPLFANTVDDEPSVDDYKTAQLLSLILELLTFCIEHHTYHIKNYVLSKDLLRRVLVLLKSRHSFLALGGLRMLRKTIGMKDEFYHRYFVRGDLFKPVVSAFQTNGSKYNLLNSAMIELFEFIRQEDIKSLTAHFIENHYKAFENVNYVQTFKHLKLRYDQHQDRMKEKSSLDAVPSILRNTTRYRRDARSLEEEEEMWFDQEDDFDDTDAVMSPMTDPLKATKYDADFEQINIKFLERMREGEFGKDSPPRIYGRGANPISININRNSPPSPNTPTPTATPATSPQGSPQSPVKQVTPAASPVTTSPAPDVDLQNKKPPGLVGLVDYADDDSEEDEEGEDGLPAAKRQRLST